MLSIYLLFPIMNAVIFCNVIIQCLLYLVNEFISLFKVPYELQVLHKRRLVNGLKKLSDNGEKVH